MTAIKLPEMPLPRELGSNMDGGYGGPLRPYGYTADQLRADRRAVARAVIEACAAVCEGVTGRPLGGYVGDYWLGMEMGGDKCADAIRAMKIEESK